jgi:hypothetical protein
LALSATTFTVGTPSSGTITGATVGSTITASGLPTGLTINGVARTWAWDGTGTAGSGSFTLTETLLGAVGSPKTTTINYTISGSSFGGAGTLSASTLSFPSPLASNPTSISIAVPADWQSGDALKLAYSATSSLTSFTVLSHTLSDADITTGTIAIGLPTLAGITYFQTLGSHSGVDSANLSNIVAWGDTTAPTITTSATQTAYEQVPLAIALTATDTGGVPALVSVGGSSGWCIDSGPDQTEFQVAIVGGVPTLQWIGNGTQTFDTGSNHVSRAQGLGNAYSVTVAAIDYSGNKSTLALTVNLNAITASISPAFTNVNNAALSTVFTSNTVTVTVAPTGLSIAASVSGTGFTYSKNGGAFVSAGSFTVQNGDTIALKVTSGAFNSITETGVLTIGLSLASQNWNVSTPGSSAQLTSAAGTSCSKLLSVTGTPALAWHIPVGNGGALEFSRATISAANTDFYAEMTLGTLASRNVMGVTDNSIDFNGGTSGFFGGGTSFPGDPTFNGFSLEIDAAGTGVDIHLNATTTTIGVGGTTAAGDVLGLRYNSSTNKLDVYYKLGAAAMAHIGTQQTITSLIPATPFLFTGGKNDNDAATINFGASTFALGGTGPQGSPSGSNIYG